MNLIYKITAILTCCFLLGISGPTNATENFFDKESFIYENPTMDKLAKLYWAIGRLDKDDISHIDNFMRITECDIYRDYFNHEFEWKQVRESAKTFVEKNRQNFPLRFQFMQPLRLAEYDIKKEEFEVYGEYKIEDTRRFEVRASNSRDIICGDSKDIEGYPKGVMLELSRPFGMTTFSLEPEAANEYISEKLEAFKKLSVAKRNKRENVFLTRDAYLVMKVKIFASAANDLVRTNEGEYIAHVLGVLEGVEIYSDKDKQHLLFVENFRKKRIKSPLELQYIAEYKAEKEARNQKSKPKDDAAAEKPAEQVEAN